VERYLALTGEFHESFNRRFGKFSGATEEILSSRKSSKASNRAASADGFERFN
jgi:hypothetical protein